MKLNVSLFLLVILSGLFITLIAGDENSGINYGDFQDNRDAEYNTRSSNVFVVDTAFYLPQFDRTRRVWIYLPQDYHTSDKSYPVMYMHDGQNLFDNKTSFAGEWCVDETMDSLIASGHKASIIVGIDNGGEKRIDEYTPFSNREYGGGQGRLYVDFIVENLKPFIDSNYRTLNDRKNTAIAGSSLGGLISFYAAMKYKSVFSKAGIMSPAFWYSENIYYIPQYFSRSELKIYFLAGDSESSSMISDIYRMTKKLERMGYPEKDYTVQIIKGGRHEEKLWRDNFADMYLWLMEE